jgi:hypothetical protein
MLMLLMNNSISASGSWIKDAQKDVVIFSMRLTSGRWKMVVEVCDDGSFAAEVGVT